MLIFSINFYDDCYEIDAFKNLFCLVIIYFIDNLFKYLYKKNNIEK